MFWLEWDSNLIRNQHLHYDYHFNVQWCGYCCAWQNWNRTEFRKLTSLQNHASKMSLNGQTPAFVFFKQECSKEHMSHLLKQADT